MLETLTVRRGGGVATVVMHRGGNNAIASDLATELESAFGELGSDPEVRAVVVASQYEKYFSVGADLTTMAAIDRDAPEAEDQIVAMVESLVAGFNAIEACPKPVIAAIGGHALGGGCELTLACDYRIMVDDGRSLIGQTETALGIIPGAGGTQRLPRLIGKARALPLLLEGRRLLAPEAEAIGLVHQAVAADEFQAAVNGLAGRLAKAATLALGLTKDAVHRGFDLPFKEAMAVEARNFARASLSQDAVVGIVSFLSKQAPEFTGR